MTTPPIDEGEYVFRQVGPKGDPIFFDPSRTPVIHRSLFIPSREDADGLSLIRSNFRSEAWSAFRPEQPTIRFRLAHLPVRILNEKAQEAGITELHFLPTPDSLDHRHGEPWAHCVATEINRIDYEKDPAAKKRIKEWALRVADLIAVQEVLGPFGEPTESDQYRPLDWQQEAGE